MNYRRDRKRRRRTKKLHNRRSKKQALEWLSHIELVRSKCSNLHGVISSIIKDRVYSVREIVTCIADRAESKGDVAYEKVQNDKLLARIKCYAREEEKWKEEKKRLLEELQAVKASNECLEMQKWNLDRNKSINVGIPKDLITSTQEALERRDLSTTNTKRDIEVYNKEYPALRPALQGGYKDLDTGEIIPVRGESKQGKKDKR